MNLLWHSLSVAFAKQVAEKSKFSEEGRPLGLKPCAIATGLRGPEGPLFHGDARIREFFRSLLEPNPLKTHPRQWIKRLLVFPCRCN
jgi:hypothetical protein